MIACDTCGCLVDPGMLQKHVDWHDEIMTYTNIEPWAKLERDLEKRVANPDRTER